MEHDHIITRDPKVHLTSRLVRWGICFKTVHSNKLPLLNCTEIQRHHSENDYLQDPDIKDNEALNLHLFK